MHFMGSKGSAMIGQTNLLLKNFANCTKLHTQNSGLSYAMAPPGCHPISLMGDGVSVNGMRLTLPYGRSHVHLTVPDHNFLNELKARYGKPKDKARLVSSRLRAVSYTHLTLPTKA